MFFSGSLQVSGLSGSAEAASSLEWRTNLYRPTVVRLPIALEGWLAHSGRKEDRRKKRWQTPRLELGVIVFFPGRGVPFTSGELHLPSRALRCSRGFPLSRFAFFILEA